MFHREACGLWIPPKVDTVGHRADREMARVDGIPGRPKKEDAMDGVCRKCFREDCRCVAMALKKDEHRASRMPDHLPSVDPLFMDAVFKAFAPEDIEEKEEG